MLKQPCKIEEPCRGASQEVSDLYRVILDIPKNFNCSAGVSCLSMFSGALHRSDPFASAPSIKLIVVLVLRPDLQISLEYWYCK